MINKIKEFNKILKEIKEIKIQGAEEVARKALYAYSIIPNKNSEKKLINSRPTEPLMRNVLRKIKKEPYKKIINHLDSFQEKINKNAFKIIKNNDVIFTHCHSSTVVKALIYAKKHGKKFEVYNTETRPIFQGRKTFLELKKSKIKVTMFIDSAAQVALLKEQGTKKVNKVFLGADALTKKGVINKIGSGLFSRIAFDNKIPVYILADSWKYSSKKIKLEKRSFKEIWKKVSLRNKSKLKNPIFELVNKKYITKIITELGILSYNDFLRKAKKI